jgi:fumarate hydratase class II
VPAEALWGPQTQRAVENFPISGRPLPGPFIHTLGLIKAAAARVNRDLGLVEKPIADAIEKAAMEVAEGKWDAEFPIDVYQTGSGTSSNMNANEVIARLASRASGLKVHPNDHVNFGQSSNDVIPTALHVSAVVQIERDLLPSLARLWMALDEKSRTFHDVLKTGRTHLMDATPIRLGQEFSGYASQVQHGIARVKATLPDLRELAIGGTAVGTGLNTHPEFGRRMASEIGKLAGTSFQEAPNHFEAQGAQDGACWASGALNSVAASLMKIANDIRLMNSGPRCGLAEITLPAIQPGSSIMPGKVNPVICESVMMVACRVIGNDASITAGGLGGVGSLLELNVAMPLIANDLCESIGLLANACDMFREKCIEGLELRPDATQTVERSLMMVTSLAPVIGYDDAAKVAKEAFKSGETIRAYVLRNKLVDPKRLDRLLDPTAMTKPGGKGPGGG